VNLYEELLENDLNPFIVFNSHGKLINFNKEAEFLFNFVSTKELFDLTVLYASITFGFEQKFINLQYGKQSFYAILVGYVTENEIILRLYKEVSKQEPLKINNNLTKTNIYTLIELSKNTTLINSQLHIKEIYDVSIPEFKLNITDFLNILNFIFEQIKTMRYITLKVYIKTGEYEIIDHKKYNIVVIEFYSKDKVNFSYNDDQKMDFNIFFNQNKISLEIPLFL
jgi:hypothetical protein